MSNKPEPTLAEKQESAIRFIEKFEGLRLKAYKDSNGRWIIGYGTRSHQGEVITKKEADRRLKAYIEQHSKYIPETLNHNQYVAYTSLVYNMGFVKAKKLLISDRINCKKILLYDKVNGKQNKGISNRRQREYELCIN